MQIITASFSEILQFWENLPNLSKEPVSFMKFLGGYHLADEIGSPTYYLAVYRNLAVVGCNSVHATGDMFRSRGLWVHPHFRKMGFGTRLLEHGISLSGGKIWSYPNKQAISTYLAAGFKVALETVNNYYVVRET